MRRYQQGVRARTVNETRAPESPIFELSTLEARGLMSTTHPLTDLPALNSLPDAAAQLYLDFNGETLLSQNGPVVIAPAYDRDGDRATFSDSELASIQEIWARVAEAYSPFNINVTTVNPGALKDKVSARVLIGGNGSFAPAGMIGTLFHGGFYTPEYGNASWVYSERVSGDPKVVALTATHESAHNFGLLHQNVGDSWATPIMRESYSSSNRYVWSKTSAQDDLVILSGLLNGFGYRPDDHGNDANSATPLTLSGATVSSSGVIEKMSDSDWFSFRTTGGAVSFAADVSRYTNNNAYGGTYHWRVRAYNIVSNKLNYSGYSNTAVVSIAVDGKLQTSVTAALLT